MTNNQFGVLLIFIGMLFFSVQDLLIKTIILEVSLIQIIVFRSFFGFTMLSIFLYFTKRKITIGSSYPLVAFFRGGLFFFGFTLFYIAVSKITLAEATSLFFISPFFMTIFSKIILNNPIGLNRLFAIIVGFLGALLIVKPEFGELNIYMILPIICAFTYSLSMILAKLTSDKDSLFQQTFHIYLGTLIVGSIIFLFLNIFPDIGGMNIFSNLNKPLLLNDSNVLIIILAISFIGSLGILLLIYAYRVGSPMTNSPSEYVLLIFSAFNGFIFLGELPDFYSIIGMCLIVGSGLYIIFRENVKDKLVVGKTTLRT